MNDYKPRVLTDGRVKVNSGKLLLVDPCLIEGEFYRRMVEDVRDIELPLIRAIGDIMRRRADNFTKVTRAVRRSIGEASALLEGIDDERERIDEDYEKQLGINRRESFQPPNVLQYEGFVIANAPQDNGIYKVEKEDGLVSISLTGRNIEGIGKVRVNSGLIALVDESRFKIGKEYHENYHAIIQVPNGTYKVFCGENRLTLKPQ